MTDLFIIMVLYNSGRTLTAVIARKKARPPGAEPWSSVNQIVLVRGTSPFKWPAIKKTTRPLPMSIANRGGRIRRLGLTTADRACHFATLCRITAALYGRRLLYTSHTAVSRRHSEDDRLTYT